MHSLVERRVAIAWKSHLIVAEKSGPRRRFAANIRRRTYDNDRFDAVIAQNRIEIGLEECIHTCA